MLPFQLKPPSYGGKLKKEKQEKASLLDRNHPLRDGGPLQRAIYDDLMAQYPKFSAALHGSFTLDTQASGYSFKVFKKIFSKAGIALLHTQLTPQRCDAAAYSQMIYATCFDLLRRVFNSDEDTFSFGAFAVFLLYSLYETNPYPTTISSETETMPMNLQDRYNPRLTFRRCYRERIRIDLEHFYYLLHLRDACLEKVSNLQAEIGNLEQTSNVTYSLARDTAEVISRLMPNFDYCAYTGPCGLEALAGHGDYPVPPTAATLKWWKENREKLLLTDPAPVVPDVPISEPYKLPTTLQEQVGEYIHRRYDVNHIQASRDRQGRQVRRSNNAAAIPLFSKKKTTLDTLACFSRRRQPEKKRVKLRHGFVEIPIDALTHRSRNTLAKTNDVLSMQETAITDQEENAPHDVHLLLPGGISTTLEDSLHDAFETLVQRKAMLPPATVAAHPEEVSTLAKSHSVATSVTGTGRNALRALLSKATSGTLSEGQSTTFLECQEDAIDEHVPPNDVFSDISSEEGDVTVAGSTVGRSALQDLLSYATDTAAGKKASKGKKTTAKRAPRKKPKGKPKKRSDEPRNPTKGSTEKSEGDSVDSDSSRSLFHDDSTSSDHNSGSDNGGRAALHALLARAAV